MVSRWFDPWLRNRLFRRYVVPFVAVVSGALLTNGLVEIYFTYQESRTALGQIQREKATAAAVRIENFVREIEGQIGWTTHPQISAASATLEPRRIEYLRLLRQVPAITEVSYLDGAGREQLRVSRLAMDVVGGGVDRSAEPVFTGPRPGQAWYGPVYFRKQSEPYMTLAVAHPNKTGVTVAEVNLKFIWDVVSRITVGKLGHAYVVDSRGQLIAHPDISLVLKKTDLSEQPYVRAARSAPAQVGDRWDDALLAKDLEGRHTLLAHTAIVPLGWIVFVEQPLVEAFAPLRGSILRTGLLMLLGVFVSAGASLALARKISRPIGALQAGAERIGAGDLTHRIDVRTKDELQDLAGQFNRMTEQLQESYATLEQKVEERTRELTETLDHQTASAEILRVISGSPTDVQPVLDAVAQSAARICGATDALIHRVEAGMLHRVSHFGSVPVAAAAAVRPVTPGTPSGRAVLEGRTIHIHDMLEEMSRGEYAEARSLQQGSGFRTVLAAPLSRDDAVIGVIVIRRPEVRPFTDKQIALLQTFADQAVIAIENVRLFKELEARTLELTRSVTELQALGDVGRAVSSTLDLDTVLEEIVSRANQLAGTDGGAIYEYEEATGRFHLRATHNFADEFVALLRETPLEPGEGAVGRAGTSREPVQVADIAETREYTSRLRDALVAGGYRSLLAVPLLSEDEVVGALVVNRREPGEFPARVVDVLRTFGTQSALAIQNARLFREIEDKSRQLEAASRHKDEFLASMSHELRTPLNAVIGFSEVLLEKMFGDVNAKQEEYLQDILASGRHLLSLINDILDLAKIEAGRMELDLEEFELAAAIDNALVLIRERATRKGLALGTAVDPGLGSVRGDQRKIKQVLLNLLSNAVKFTPEGGRVEVRAQRLDGHVEVAVTDTGIGIAPEDQDAVFEEFRQVGTDYAKKHEGTGLGLTLSRKFVELHGGSIAVKSRPGEGSTFTFTLPVSTGTWPAS
ncbi:MAG TPA: GAF domain-containing protein [Methylomirabilota bacterium]|nr:GAF domain-containing protein [Methylomirabilota bacterium]